MFKDLFKRLKKAELLWNTARVHTNQAIQYEHLRQSIVWYISNHKKRDTLLEWLRADSSEHTQVILADVNERLQWKDYEKERFNSLRTQQEFDWNSYALTRQLTWPNDFESEIIKKEWITKFINLAWDAAPGYSVIKNFKMHKEAFDWLRSKHAFPDLIEVIGPPLKEHHSSNGELLIQRKRELLLLGLFNWRDFIVTYCRWRVSDNPKHYWAKPDRKLSWTWFVAVACPVPRVELNEAEAMLRPPNAFTWTPLKSAAPKWKIAASTKTEAGMKRLPRHVLCAHCHRYFVSADTQRIHYKGRLTRFCNEHAILLKQINILRKKHPFKS